MTEVIPEDSISIMPNPNPTTAVEIRGTDSPTGTDSPGTSQMSPPPSYYDIPGISVKTNAEYHFMQIEIIK